jgi:hypothetical protein
MLNYENKGWKYNLTLLHLKLDFRWDLNLNWTQNKSLVVELLNGIENLQLAGLQGGISINATQGNLMERSEVVISFTLIMANLLLTKQDLHLELEHTRTGESNNVIGDINADWKAGLNNIYLQKNLSFLLDMQKGGDVFSLDTWYGYATGMYFLPLIMN